MRGISISRVRTSGRSARILSRATYGSGAVPTTSRSGSPARASARSLRTMAESSTINTRILDDSGIHVYVEDRDHRALGDSGGLHGGVVRDLAENPGAAGI